MEAVLAAVVSGILNGFLSANELIEVKMRQGSLFVKWDGDLLSPVLLSAQQPQFSMESFMCKTYQRYQNRD